MRARILFVLFVFSISSTSQLVTTTVIAQTTNATLNGQVTDTSGAVVPNARVVAVNDATNVRYETKTNNDGIYVEPNLPPGIYHIEITKEGFKTVMQPGIELHVEDARAANYTLQVGATSETVTVQASSYMINTQDATVSTTIDHNFAENLPLNGRSFQTLLLLTPGTVLVPTSGGSTDNGGTFSVNGQRGNANSFTVDGVSANLGGFVFTSNQAQLNGANPSFTVAGTTQGMVSVDALQEFKIQTSTYAPEFGRQPGGQVSLLTRSGTNAFHGTAFDYLRNTVFDANDWFRNASNIPRGAERQNDFGGTLGGPMFKDKTFFFFSYEGLRLLQPISQIVTVPSLRLRQEAAPAYQTILNSWPIPDGPEFVRNGTPTGGAPYTFSQSFPTNIDSYAIKIDQTLRRNLHIFGRFSDTGSDFAIPNSAPNNTETDKVTSRSLTLGTDFSIRPNLQNEIRANYSVNVSSRSAGLDLVGGATKFDTAVLSPAPLLPGVAVPWILRLPGVPGVFSTSAGKNGKYSQRQINLTDNVSYSIGSHQLKWGIDYRRLFPILARPPLGASYLITSESDIKAGNVTFALSGASEIPHPIFTNFSVYAQDTWRASNRLGLTFGLRWELNPAAGERNGIQPLNVIGLNDPATATLAPLNSQLYKTTYNNFAPRIGLAYQIRQSPGHETVVRGGFGIFYDLNSETAIAGFGGAPFVSSSPVLRSLPFPFAPNVFQVPSLPGPLPTPPFFVSAVDPNLKLPYTMQWNVSVEQSLGPNQVVSASYVASAGNRLLRSENLFDFNPTFSQVTVVRNASSSNYQSLQLQFSRRLSKGLQALVSYTYSHSIDNASDGQVILSAALTGGNFLNPNIDRGNSAFDLRHTFRAAVTYNVPTWNANFLSKAVLGGWSVDTIGIAQTGPPADLVGGQYFPSAVPDGFFNLRPNVVPGLPLYLYGSQCASANGATPCPGGWGFNPSAFTPVPQDANGNPTQLQGTLGRNVLRSFGAWQADFALHRQFNFTERVNLQFRGEFFNIFNHPNFVISSNFVGTGQFGISGSMLSGNFGAGLNSLYVIGGPRSIQLALKLSF